VAELFEHLAVEDIQHAADVLRPVYDRLNGSDGFVSLEVSPYLAMDTKGTIAEAKRLWKDVHRKNLMVKVPATPGGPAAIEHLIRRRHQHQHHRCCFAKVYGPKSPKPISRAWKNMSRMAAILPCRERASFFVSRIDYRGRQGLG